MVIIPLSHNVHSSVLKLIAIVFSYAKVATTTYKVSSQFSFICFPTHATHPQNY